MKLDHVVYFTKHSPSETVAQQAILGHHAVVGGRHEKWGTRNALLYTSNAYIEWLSVDDINVAIQSDQLLTKLLLHDIREREGWGTLCFSVDDIGKLDGDLRDRGFDTSGVLHAQRKTPDGQIRKWRMLFVNYPVSDSLPLPFFIQWEEPEKARFEKLRSDGTILPSNEKLIIRECIFGVKEPWQEVSRWAALLSRPAASSEIIMIQNVVLRFVQKEVQQPERLLDVKIQIDSDD